MNRIDLTHKINQLKKELQSLKEGVREPVKVTMLECPTEKTWMEVKRRALVTVGKEPITEPTQEWKKAILRARHSPIRYITFSFMLENIPTWVATHLVRHVHAQPYVRSQRNDRQDNYDRTKAPQDAPVNMIWDMNAEELLTIMNKRLCKQAAKETREVVLQMKLLVTSICPEFAKECTPTCEYEAHRCKEMYPCWKEKK